MRERCRSTYPIRRAAASLAAALSLERRTVHIPDVAGRSRITTCRELAARRRLPQPCSACRCCEDETPIGVIAVDRTDVRPFTDKQIELLTTFADQAVIAIENTRLFEEVQARTRELTESLEYQTATSEVLDVISRSPFDAAAGASTPSSRARRGCARPMQRVSFCFDGERHSLSLPAQWSRRSSTRSRERYPMRAGRGVAHRARATRRRHVVHIPDVLRRSRVSASRDSAERSAIAARCRRAACCAKAVPSASSSLRAARSEPFTEQQIELLKTFADQAVIAIENARLFEEVQARNRDLTALWAKSAAR